MTLERLDVRIKIAVFVVIMIALFVFSHPLGNLALLVILLAALIAVRTPMGGLWAMLQPLLLVFVLIVAVTMFTSSQYTLPENAQVLFSLWGWPVTLGALLVGLNFVARILLMVVATYAFTISTPIDDLLVVMSKMHAPYWLSILVTTALSFIPTMVHKKDLIVEAQRARGARVKDTGPVGQIVSFIPIMVPLITNSILLADNLAVAMTNRGYGATNSMTAMRDLKFRTVDILVLAAAAIALGVVFWLRFGLGYGVV
jgi:energy-coupling factor transport system permease protein